MEKSLPKINLPYGELAVHTGRGYTDMVREEMVVPLKEWNNNIEKLLFEDALIVKATSDGQYQNSVKLPKAAYSEPSILFLQSPIKWLKQKEWASTHLIYDASHTAQKEYWELVQRTLNFCTRYTNEIDQPFVNYRACVMGHHGRFIQLPQHPGIRSISLHHDHLVLIPPALPGRFYDAADFGLPDEVKLMSARQSLIPYALENFTYFIADSFSQPIHTRLQPPPGYEFEIPNQPDAIAALLREHFLAYKTAMDASEWIEKAELDENYNRHFNIKHKEKRGRVIQPAFTIYILIQDYASFRVIISPSLVGIGGPERAGILLKRGPQHPPQISDFYIKLLIHDLCHELCSS